MLSFYYFRTSFLVLTVLAFTLNACKNGTSGDVGPQGPAGAQGAKGDTGAQGPKGEPGAPANVIYSTWINVSFTGSGSTYTGTLSAPSITQDILDKADIRVYWKDGDRVVPLPYAQTIGSTTYTVHQRFYVGRIELLANYLLTSQPMRYIIIPGTTSGGRQVAVDWNDYAAVKAYYQLPD